MIYQDVEEVTTKQVAVLEGRVATIEAQIIAKQEALKVEDSKRRDQELRDEIKQLRRDRDKVHGEIYRCQEDAFKELLKKEYGVTDNPKFEKAYAIAYEHGHSSGFSEIEGFFMDIVELIA